MIVTPCRAIVLSFLFVSLALSPACGGPASRGGGQPGASATSIEIPEITEEIIYERINDTRVRDVPEETGAGQPTYWNFDEHEPKEIKVVDKQMNGARATLVLDIKTESAPGARIHRKLAGQIRTEWRLESGWVLRRWEIVDTENISMKYKDLPKNPPDNSNIPTR